MDETPIAHIETRPEHRRLLAALLIATSTALVLGVTFKSPTQLEANDISRWCTVWSLIERGTYAIDECPWQKKTQDKVKKPDKLTAPTATDSLLKKFEFAIAPQSWKIGERTERFYSSKPPLLPTMIAGALYPFRLVWGVPLDQETVVARVTREVEKPDPNDPEKTIRVIETPPPIKWPVYVFYFKPVIVVLNALPLLVFLILFTRVLDRYAKSDWSWMASLFAASWGTLLITFYQTLNNHTVAAYSAFFALYNALQIWDGKRASGWRFAFTGFWGAFCACNELPAASFGVLLFLWIFLKALWKTFAYFVPAALVPIAAFLITQFIAMGQFTPVYEEFGTKAYTYEGSYWNDPLEFDYLNVHPEPKSVYLMHMLVGHHGVFSLSPILIFSILGIFLVIRAGPPGLRGVALMSVALTVAMVAFYDWNPKARNYGGSTQGLRWLLWLVPFWLLTLPAGLEPGAQRRGFRWLALLALAASVFSVGYSLRHPWSHPWILDMMENFGWYSLRR